MLPKVSGTATPWGIAYKITGKTFEYVSSSDGTLWSTTDSRNFRSNPNLLLSVLCDIIVKVYLLFNRVEVNTTKWIKILGNMDPEMRGRIISGGLKRQSEVREGKR